MLMTRIFMIDYLLRRTGFQKPYKKVQKKLEDQYRTAKKVLSPMSFAEEISLIAFKVLSISSSE